MAPRQGNYLVEKVDPYFEFQERPIKCSIIIVMYMYSNFWPLLHRLIVLYYALHTVILPVQYPV